MNMFPQTLMQIRETIQLIVMWI